MKFGLILANQYLMHESMATRMREVFDQVGLIRDLGFDLITLGQHHLATPYQMPSSVAFLGRLAADAGDLRIGITVFLLPLHNPVDIAEQVATLDAISNGRMIFGVGLGYRDEECEAFGITMKERAPRFEEALEIIKLLWTNDEVEYRGRFYTIPKISSTIRPTQLPHPPIWMAANNDAAIRRAGRLGHPWAINPHVTFDLLRSQIALYRSTLAEHGHPRPAELPMFREAWIAPTREQAWAEAAPHLAAKYAAYASWGQDKAIPEEQTFAKPLEDLAKDRFIIGTPDDLIAECERAARELGVTTMVLRVQWPGMDPERVKQEIRQIGEEVLPACARF